MKTIFPYIVAILVILGFFGVIGLLVFKVVPPESENVVFAMVGFLGAGFGAVMNHIFGSSEGSKRKTEMMSTNKNT